MAPNWLYFEGMPVTLSVKNAPDDVVARLRERAKRNHRSLQGELLAIIEAATTEDDKLGPGPVYVIPPRTSPSANPPPAITNPGGVPLTAEVLDALMARIKALNLSQDGERSVDIIRRTRDAGYSYATNPNHHVDNDEGR